MGRRLLVTAALAGAFAAAAAGWAKSLLRTEPRVPSIQIVDVRPLQTSDPLLRDLFNHEFAVRIALTDWRLHPYLPGATASDNRRDGGHWRLYVDGELLGDVHTPVVHTTYLAPGTHWIAAELRNVDDTALRPPVWSEPVIMYVPKHLRCWQASQPEETGVLEGGAASPKLPGPRAADCR